MKSSQWPFSGLEPPEAPSHLRQRVLEAARLARGAEEVEEPVEWTLRLWRSRGLWLGWAACMVLLLGVNAWLSMPGAVASSEAAAKGRAGFPLEGGSPERIAESTPSWRLFEVQRILTSDTPSLFTRSGGSENLVETYIALREVL